MSYNWLTQYNSPNYTPANRVQATWGRPRTIEAIAIHWWGDPSQNPSFEGVVNYLCRANGSSSAHLVATGTGRKVACIVNFADASWATNSANPYTISIECDPRCRDEDYDVIAELIAQLRQVYGNLPLVPHKQFVATACPGNYNLDRLNKIAASKKVSKDSAWGDVKSILGEDEVKILLPPVFNKEYYLKNNSDLIAAKVDPAEHWVSSGAKEGRNASSSFSVREYLENYEDLRKNFKQDYVAAIEHYINHGIAEGRFGTRAGLAKQRSEEQAVAAVPGLQKSLTDANIKIKQLEQELASEKPSKDGFNENDRETLSGIQKAVQSIWDALKAIFKV